MGQFRTTEDGGEGATVMPRQVVKETPFMNRSGEFSYTENESLQLVRIPYGENQRFAMYIALPKRDADLAALVQGLSRQGFNHEASFDALVRSMGTRPGDVSIPRFKMEFGKELSGILAALGMPVAFSDAADFRGMIKNESVKIDKVLHKAVVEVDEAGTVAAAATVVGMVRTTSIHPITPPFTFTADHPFFFCIRDDQTGTMLFSGVVRDPIDPKGGVIEEVPTLKLTGLDGDWASVLADKKGEVELLIPATNSEVMKVRGKSPYEDVVKAKLDKLGFRMKSHRPSRNQISENPNDKVWTITVVAEK